MDAIASQITSLTIVYSMVYSHADQRKHQSSASLAFVRGIHRGPVNSPHKWPVTRNMFPFDDVIMRKLACFVEMALWWPNTVYFWSLHWYSNEFIYDTCLLMKTCNVKHIKIMQLMIIGMDVFVWQMYKTSLDTLTRRLKFNVKFIWQITNKRLSCLQLQIFLYNVCLIWCQMILSRSWYTHFETSLFEWTQVKMESRE